MQDKDVIDTQLDFYRKGKAGCLFLAHAAGDPAKYEWRLSVARPETGEIESLIRSAVSLTDVSTQSVIFPAVITEDDLVNFFRVLRDTSSFSIGQRKRFKGMICLGYRIKISEMTSWVTGFGGFSFLPETRQAVFTELTFRTKPRPEYKKIMKEAPPGVLHLADMNMKGMGENKFKSLWFGSFDNTEKVLGHKPDLRSTAKTTFAVPVSLWKRV